MQTNTIKDNEIKRTSTINFSNRGIGLIERIVRTNKKVSLLFSDIGNSLQIITKTKIVEAKYTFGEKDVLFTRQFNNIDLGVIFSIEKRIISISKGTVGNGIDVIEIVTPSTKIILEVKAEEIAPEAEGKWRFIKVRR